MGFSEQFRAGMIAFRTFTLPKNFPKDWHRTWKWWFGRWFSSRGSVFSGSMLIFLCVAAISPLKKWKQSCPVVQLSRSRICFFVGCHFFGARIHLLLVVRKGVMPVYLLVLMSSRSLWKLIWEKTKKTISFSIWGGVPAVSRWWFEIFFIFTPSWGRFPFWLTFSDGLKPVMQSFVGFMWEVDSNYTSNHQGGDTVPIFFGTTYASMATLGN